MTRPLFLDEADWPSKLGVDMETRVEEELARAGDLDSAACRTCIVPFYVAIELLTTPARNGTAQTMANTDIDGKTTDSALLAEPVRHCWAAEHPRTVQHNKKLSPPHLSF